MSISARSLLLAAIMVAVAAQADDSKLTIHGYLSQAYAQSDIEDDPELLSWLEGGILGIDEDGTTDYRTLALQIRYDFHAKSAMLFQLDHERLGNSPATDSRDDIEIDWAFFQHRFGPGSTIRVGRIPLAWGIYNEIRDVGTLLPFFRPVDEIYQESESFDESLNGLQVSHTFFAGSDWPLTIDLFGGESDREAVSIDAQGNRIRSSGSVDRIGARLRIETPVEGLAFGFGVLDEDQKGALLASGETLPIESWLASVEADFDRVLIRAEYYDQQAIFDIPSFGRTDFDKDSFYVETVVRATDTFDVMAQYVKSDELAFVIDDPSVNPLIVSSEPTDISSSEARALGLRYHAHANVLVRAEYHWREESIPRFSQLTLLPRPDGRLTIGLPTDTGDANYGIVSVSVSF